MRCTHTGSCKVGRFGCSFLCRPARSVRPQWCVFSRSAGGYTIAPRITPRQYRWALPHSSPALIPPSQPRSSRGPASPFPNTADQACSDSPYRPSSFRTAQASPPPSSHECSQILHSFKPIGPDSSTANLLPLVPPNFCPTA